MKKIDLSQALNTLANVGVIAGILFLAIEVRQNQESLDQANELTRAAILTEGAEKFNDWRALLLQDPELHAIYARGEAGEELSPEEARRYGTICSNLFWTYAASYQQFVLFGDEVRAIEGPGLAARNQLESPRQRQCWERYFDMARGWGYGPFIDTLLSDQLE
jgi:hypothetical protein